MINTKNIIDKPTIEEIIEIEKLQRRMYDEGKLSFKDYNRVDDVCDHLREIINLEKISNDQLDKLNMLIDERNKIIRNAKFSLFRLIINNNTLFRIVFGLIALAIYYLHQYFSY